MNKQDLVAAVAKAADMTKEKAAEAVDAVFDSITAGLKQDGEVRLMGFGTFAAAKRAASVGRNPRTGAEIQIPASTAVRFGGKPSDNLFVAGEMMAGNVLGQGYTAGVGMSIGTAFGRIAGSQAAAATGHPASHSTAGAALDTA